MDVVAWLRGLGLERYAQAFRDNDVDDEVLPELTSDDLISIGVTSVGHRRKLLAAIAGLGAEMPTATVTTAPRDAPAPANAERRQLTVMFCDLVGSTALSACLDPEDLREVIAAYHRAIAEVIARFDGFVARYMGDGVLAYFGYPQAHEDDAERAVRAGLVAVAAVTALATPTAGKLQCRIGISTGLSVVGDLIGSGAAQEEAVIGATPNIAARLQALARPNTVVIADSTRRHVGSLFELADLGPQAIKGLGEPLRAWAVSAESRVDSRFEALRSSETPFVGREAEIGILLGLWQKAKHGAGRVVLLSGEPGIGKSRLAAVLQQHLGADPHNLLRYFCSPHHQNTSLFPLIGQLEREARFEPHDAPEAKLDKLEALLASAALHVENRALIAELLSLPGSDRYGASDLSPQRKKQETLAALVRILTASASRQPVLMIVEDLHWMDATSCEFLDLVIDRIEKLPVLLVATSRPGFRPAWTGLSPVTSLEIPRLGPGFCVTMVERIAELKGSLSPDLVAEIVDRTDGVPLFLEELTKAVLENAALGTIPATLHASLIARLDRLGPMVKEVAQIGAAIGRDFSYDLLAAAARRTGPELEEALGRLADAGLVLMRGAPPNVTFLFKHALVQDTAYSMLLRNARKALHARIAHALLERFPSVAETQPQILAHHFSEAGLVGQAVAFWSRAGQQSAAKSAFIEAIAQLRRGLQLIAEQPESRERRQRELEFLVTLAPALMEEKGHASPDVAEVLARSRSLIVETEAAGTILHFSVLYGLWVAQYLGGEPIAALYQAKEFLSLARSQTQSGLLLIGHRLVGSALMPIGDYRKALSHLNRAVTLYQPEEHQALAFRFGADIGITAICVRGWALWHRGFPEQAKTAIEEGLQYARQSVHRHTLAYALIYTGLTTLSGRWTEAGEKAANDLVSLTREHGFALFLGYGLILQGGVMAQSGQGVAAVERIREGMAAMQATGARRAESFALGLLAEALANSGAIVEGLSALAAALTAAEACGAYWADAELHRLRGEFLSRLASPDWSQVETCLRTALAMARRQGSRGFALRAAVSLARLLCDQGRRDEARALLAPIYGWFTEGFDTTDLKDAKALLGELA